MCSGDTENERSNKRLFSSQGALNWLLSAMLFISARYTYIFSLRQEWLSKACAQLRGSRRVARPPARRPRPLAERAPGRLSTPQKLLYPLSALRARSTGSTRARANPPENIYNAIGFCQQKNANVFSLVTFSNTCTYSCWELQTPMSLTQHLITLAHKMNIVIYL
jgi:hypothetical protein